MSSQQIISSSAMPLQKLPPYPDGANSPMTAGIVTQKQNAELQNTRNKIGGYKRHRRLKGGAVSVQVPPVPTGTVNPAATDSNYKDITQLAQQQQTDMVFDNAKNPSDTASLAAKQQALHSGKVGGKKGGSWPLWRCLSGGKRKTKRRSKKNKKRRSRRR